MYIDVFSFVLFFLLYFLDWLQIWGSSYFPASTSQLTGITGTIHLAWADLSDFWKRQHIFIYLVLGIEPRALCMLSILYHWAIPSTQIFKNLHYYDQCYACVERIFFLNYHLRYMLGPLMFLLGHSKSGYPELQFF